MIQIEVMCMRRCYNIDSHADPCVIPVQVQQQGTIFALLGKNFKVDKFNSVRILEWLY
jgi:hypothetical protein